MYCVSTCGYVHMWAQVVVKSKRQSHSVLELGWFGELSDLVVGTKHEPTAGSVLMALWAISPVFIMTFQAIL